MNCYLHPTLPAAASCIACGQGVCPGCRQIVAGHVMCSPCVQAAQATLADRPGTEAGQHAEAPAARGTVQQPPTPPDAVWTESAPAWAEPAPAAPGEMGVLPGKDPGILRRLVRGWLWGIVYGQWWTLWSFLSAILWGRVFSGRWSVTELVAEFFVYGFFGSCAGILIALAKARENTGVIIGVAVGVGVCLLEAGLAGNPAVLINLFFFYFTGRYVGAGLSGRVMRPVGPQVPVASGPAAPPAGSGPRPPRETANY